MKKISCVALVLAVLVAFGTAAPVYAACTYDPALVWHGLGFSFTNCADASPVSGFIYEVASAATVNSAGQDFVCEVGFVNNGIGVPCQPEAGTAGDGIVTAYYNWFTTGSVGCPNPDPTAVGQGAGSNVIAVQIVDNAGKSAILTVGFDAGLNGYTLEAAYPFDGANLGAVECSYANSPSLVSLSAGPSPSADTVCVNVPVPQVFSDCDPSSAGGALGSCPTGTPLPVNRGRVYTRDAACGSSPDARLAGWTLLPNAPDGQGNACNLINRPLTGCAFVAATANIGGLETTGVTGSFQVGGASAANDKIKIDQAALVQGKLLVKFSTTNESLTTGFNVYAGETKLNQTTIRAKGTGSNSYSFEIGRGAVKSNKSVTVEALKSDGTVEKVTASLK